MRLLEKQKPAEIQQVPVFMVEAGGVESKLALFANWLTLQVFPLISAGNTHLQNPSIVEIPSMFSTNLKKMWPTTWPIKPSLLTTNPTEQPHALVFA